MTAAEVARGLAGHHWSQCRFAANPGLELSALFHALSFARVAARRGSRDDLEALLFLLWQTGGWFADHGENEFGTQFDAAALNLASDLADRGCEAMGEMVSVAAPSLPAATLTEARRQRSEELSYLDFPAVTLALAGMTTRPPDFTLEAR